MGLWPSSQNKSSPLRLLGPSVFMPTSQSSDCSLPTLVSEIVESSVWVPTGPRGTFPDREAIKLQWLWLPRRCAPPSLAVSQSSCGSLPILDPVVRPEFCSVPHVGEGHLPDRYQSRCSSRHIPATRQSAENFRSTVACPLATAMDSVSAQEAATTVLPKVQSCRYPVARQ